LIVQHFTEGNIMNACASIHSAPALRATTVLRLSPDRPVEPRKRANGDGDGALLAGVARPTRTNETRSLAALLPDVLARYGVAPRQLTDAPTMDALA
jgi:hypothetical protein